MKVLVVLMMVFLLAFPVSAAQIQPPEVPKSGQALMPEDTSDFGSGLWQMLRSAIGKIRPDLAEAGKLCLGIIAIILLVSMVQTLPGSVKMTADMAGTVSIALMLLGSTNSMVALGSTTVRELSEYGKLLLPVMTSAMAAQGGITSSGALYAGTAFFDSLLAGLVSSVLTPMIYLYLVLQAANSALGEDVLKKMGDFVKWLMVWCLKILLYVFTGYMGITGVISGTTDAATLKAAKITISGVVPVVGGILSDASEAVLVGAGVVKNAAGIYGIFAIMAVFLTPFLRIGIHYLLLKATVAVSAVFGSKRMCELTGCFSTAMGLLLAMTGSVCLLLLISCVCFLKGVG